LLRLIWSSGLYPQPSSVRRHESQFAGFGFHSISSLTGTNARRGSGAGDGASCAAKVTPAESARTDVNKILREVMRFLFKRVG
jgi:hypothetical protein